MNNLPDTGWYVQYLRIFLLFLFFLIPCITLTQNLPEVRHDSLTWHFDEGDKKSFSLGAFLVDLFTPQIIIDTKEIRKYISDERFQTMRHHDGDLRAADAIYLKSLRIADYNIARALFLSFMAVLEHRNVEISLPLIGKCTLPLTFENDTIFSTRINHLPAHMYYDSPSSLQGDRDKLQHFFGSAFLSYATEAPALTKFVGNAIEWGEALIVVGGVDDHRDKRANTQGKCFGRDLLFVETILPSDYLTFALEERK